MGEEFKVIFQINVDQIPRAVDLLRNKTNVIFNSTSMTIDKELNKFFKHSTNIRWDNCHACIINNLNNGRLFELRERGCKIRIIK